MKKIRAVIYSGAVLVLASFAVGCGTLGTFNPATERREFIVIPTQEEVAMGQGIHKQIEAESKFVNDERYNRVKAVGAKIAQVSDRQEYRQEFYLVDKKDLNAFTTPGGKVYIYTGLLERLKTDDQLAFVLAHEVGHGAARHTVKKFQAALGYSLIGNIVLNQIDSNMSRQVTALSTGAIMNIVFSAYGRKDEYEADRLGIKYMYLAGFDTDGAVEALELLEKESKGPRIPVILRSHPYVTDRVKAAKEQIPAIKEKYAE